VPRQQISHQTPVASASGVLVNQETELDCVLQVIQQGQIEGDLNIQQSCVEILAPELVNFSSESARQLTAQAHDLLVSQRCAESTALYEQAYEQEQTLAVRGYLAQRILNAQQCQQGLIIISRQRADRVKAQERPTASLLTEENALFQELLRSGHDALKIGACELAQALYTRAEAQAQARDSQIFAALQRQQAQSCFAAQHRVQQTPAPHASPSTVPDPMPAQPTPALTPQPRFTPTPLPTAFVLPGASAVPEAPPAPSGFRAENIQGDQLTLRWEPVAGALFYQIYRNGTLLIDQIQNTVQTVLSLQPRTAYLFMLRAVNAQGGSLPLGLEVMTSGFLSSGQSLIYTGSQGLGVMQLDGSQPSPLFQPEQPMAVSPDRSRVAHGALKISNIWGDNTLAIAHQLSEIRDLSWSPDSQKLVFRARSIHQLNELYILQADGSQLQQATSFRHVSQPSAWSPDGQKLAFIGAASGQDRLFSVSLNALATPDLLSEQSLSGPLIWWPDGTQLLCYSDSTATEAYLLNLSNGVLTPLPILSGLLISAYQFSPDAQQLVFSASGNLYRFQLNTQQIVQLTDTGEDHHPVWSGDGSHIYFDSRRHGTPHIYRMNSQGQQIEQISSPPGQYRQPLWVN